MPKLIQPRQRLTATATKVGLLNKLMGRIGSLTFVSTQQKSARESTPTPSMIPHFG